MIRSCHSCGPKRRRRKSSRWSTISIPSAINGSRTLRPSSWPIRRARQRFRNELTAFLETDQYKGLTLDIEAFPETSRGDYSQLVQELHDDLQTKGLKLYIAVPVNDRQFDYAGVAQVSDGLILMNYDEHYPGGTPGPVASQDWFVKNLEDALAVVPREKIIAAIGNYGYDWARKPGQKKGTPPEAFTTCRCRTRGSKPKKPIPTLTSTATR